MKIVEEYQEKYVTKVINITKADYLGDYTIKLRFNDNTDHEVNFKSFLINSNHPAIRKYLDETKFKHFKLIDGNLNWNDYDMIFPVGDLYEGKI